METKAAKKLLKLIKFPSSKDTMLVGAVNKGDTECAQWTKRGGYAGAKTIDKCLDAAKAAGWKPEERQSSMSPDGSVASSNQTLVGPEGTKLSWCKSYGITKADNWFQLDVKFPG